MSSQTGGGCGCGCIKNILWIGFLMLVGYLLLTMCTTGA